MTITLPLQVQDPQERTAGALERIATALEQLVVEFIDTRSTDEPLPAEPEWVQPLPPDIVAQPAMAVAVGPAAYQRPAAAPQSSAIPAQPSRPCPTHGWTWKLVPAGFSRKTSKNYDAFWACNVRGCDQRP